MRILLALLALVAVFAQPTLAEGPPSATTPQARPLENDEFTRYLKALDSMMTIRTSAEEQFLANPEKGRDANVAASYMKQAKHAMESNGFTNESFNTVHWNVMQAFAQLEIQANADDVRETLSQQREELAAAKGQIPDEEYTVATRRLENTEAMLNGLGGVPNENIELVRNNLANLKSTFERSMGSAKPGYRKKPETSDK